MSLTTRSAGNGVNTCSAPAGIPTYAPGVRPTAAQSSTTPVRPTGDDSPISPRVRSGGPSGDSGSFSMTRRSGPVSRDWFAWPRFSCVRTVDDQPGFCSTRTVGFGARYQGTRRPGRWWCSAGTRPGQVWADPADAIVADYPRWPCRWRGCSGSGLPPAAPGIGAGGKGGIRTHGGGFSRPNRLAGDPFRPLRHLPVSISPGGEGGIRTPGAHRPAVFKTAAFDHSATSPHNTLDRPRALRSSVRLTPKVYQHRPVPSH